MCVCCRLLACRCFCLSVIVGQLNDCDLLIASSSCSLKPSLFSVLVLLTHVCKHLLSAL